MSLRLDLGTKPEGLEIKTHGNILPEDIVYLGNYDISIEDFLVCAYYVLTNTELYENDPREKFVRCIKKMHIVEGWNKEGVRYESDLDPIGRVIKEE